MQYWKYKGNGASPELQNVVVACRSECGLRSDFEKTTEDIDDWQVSGIDIRSFGEE